MHLSISPALTAFLIVGALLVIVVGSFWHNLYPMSGQNNIIGYIAPVNESLWEHQKLIIFPMAIFVAILWCFLGKYLNNPLTALILAILAGIILVIGLFILYTGFNVDNSNIFADIMLYVAAIVIGMFVIYYTTMARKFDNRAEAVSGIALVFLVIITFIWTYNPPCDCGIWKIPDEEH